MVNPIENPEFLSPNPELERARGLLKSAFNILPEESYFPDKHEIRQDLITAHEDKDRAIQQEVENILDSIPREEKIFVIQRLGLAHAIHNISSLMRRGFDHYLAQVPPADSRPDFMRDSYNFRRNAEVALRNQEEIETQRAQLLERGQENSHGVVLSVDAHADFEDREGLLQKFFPSLEQLRQLGITRIVLLDEAAPSASSIQQTRIDNPPRDWDKSKIFSTLREYKNSGFSVTAFGVDPRKEK
jgi:hypothetical protein